MKCATFLSLSYYPNDCSEIVSGIDEGKRFDDIVALCDQLAMAGKIVFVAARIGNHRGEGLKKFSISFPNLIQLIC